MAWTSVSHLGLFLCLSGIENASDIALYSGLGAAVVAVAVLVIGVTLYRRSHSDYGVDVIDSSALTGGFQTFNFKTVRQGQRHRSPNTLSSGPWASLTQVPPCSWPCVKVALGPGSRYQSVSIQDNTKFDKMIFLVLSNCEDAWISIYYWQHSSEVVQPLMYRMLNELIFSNYPTFIFKETWFCFICSILLTKIFNTKGWGNSCRSWLPKHLYYIDFIIYSFQISKRDLKDI